MLAETMRQKKNISYKSVDTIWQNCREISNFFGEMNVKNHSSQQRVQRVRSPCCFDQYCPASFPKNFPGIIYDESKEKHFLENQYHTREFSWENYDNSSLRC